MLYDKLFKTDLQNIVTVLFPYDNSELRLREIHPISLGKEGKRKTDKLNKSYL